MRCEINFAQTGLAPSCKCLPSKNTWTGIVALLPSWPHCKGKSVLFDLSDTWRLTISQLTAKCWWRVGRWLADSRPTHSRHVLVGQSILLPTARAFGQPWALYETSSWYFRGFEIINQCDTSSQRYSCHRTCHMSTHIKEDSYRMSATYRVAILLEVIYKTLWI